MPFDSNADVRYTFGTARWPQSVTLHSVFSHGVVPSPNLPPLLLPPKYFDPFWTWIERSTPTCLTACLKTVASAGSSWFCQVVHVSLKPFAYPAAAISDFALAMSMCRCGSFAVYG